MTTPPPPPPPKNPLSLLGIFARGMCMGAADIVPGVSGGTIAFISGIYTRLLSAIAVYTHPPFWQALRRLQIRQLWRLTDAPFVLTLVGGIITAALLLARLLKHWLETAPHLLLGFFLGLVAASIVTIACRLAARPSPRHYAAAVAAAAAAYFVTTLPPAAEAAPALPALFAGGAIAICAMILPGISGSYLLLLMGLYPTIITAVSERDLLPLAVFAAGCGMGLLLFARLLSTLVKRHTTATLMTLLGVMTGALPVLWPWKLATEPGLKLILQPNTTPAQFAATAATDPQILLILFLAAAGAATVLAINAIATQKNPPKAPRA